VTDSFEIKSAQLPAMALVLKSGNMVTVCKELMLAYGAGGDNPDFFDNDALIVDCSKLKGNAATVDLRSLQQTLVDCRLKPIGVRSNVPDVTQQAQSLGWLVVQDEIVKGKPAAEPRKPVPPPVPVVKEVVHEVIREVPAPSTLVLDKPVRAGQKIYARGGDLVVMAMVNPGGEVIADGNIHVYAPLRGKAMAGASGNLQARIFSTCLEPELVSIAGVYRTSEHTLPKGIHGCAAQVRLSNDGQEKLLFEALAVSSLHL